MAITSTTDGLRIDYSERSYEALRQDIDDLITEILPEWSDRSAYDPGIVILQYMARLGAYINFMVDRRAEENSAETLRLYSSLERLGKLYDYTPYNQTTASVPVMFTVTGSGTIYAGTQVSSAQNAANPAESYEVLSDETILGAGTYPIICHHGRTTTDYILGISDGKPGQSYTILQTPVAQSSTGFPAVTISVLESSSWTQWTAVPNFLNSTDTSKHFTVTYDDRKRVVVTFGDGIHGLIPPLASVDSIRATYRIGGGATGNRPGVGTITQVTANMGSSIISSVVNLAKPSGGRDLQSLDEAKAAYKLKVNTQDADVRFSDVKGSLLTAGLGIGHVNITRGSHALDMNVAISAAGSNPVPSGDWSSTNQSGSGLLGAVGAYIAERITESWKISVIPAIPVPVITNLLISCQSWAYQRDVLVRAKEAITAFFDDSLQDFGKAIRISDFYRIIEELDGVDYVEIPEFRRNPRASFVSGSDGALFTGFSVGQNIKEEEWTVEFLNSTYFKLVGSRSGRQSTGAINVPQGYTTDLGDLSFRVTSLPGVTLQAGSTYKMQTSSFSGTVPINESEIVVLGTSSIQMINGIK